MSKVLNVMVNKLVESLNNFADPRLLDPLVLLTAVMSFQRPYIVLVDDDEDFLELMEYFLLGKYPLFEFIKFNCPLDAQKFIFKHREEIAFIISDYHMKRTNGIRFFQNIKSIGISIPFLIVSSDTSQKVQQEAEKIGVTDYVLKSLDIYEMFNTIESYVRTVQVF
ncbi:MAG: Transcriptional regulatory protein ZraR [Candidatus Heimdallarchaeota archaeon LC_3]|nr:MAG: Transcriptional regulatory protein ZraR [Candidatus Heimdallarchaeota archaeon LC_3]